MLKKATVAFAVLWFVVLLTACAGGGAATSTPTPPAPTPTLVALTWPTPLPVPTATAVAATRLVVANTGGQGVFIRKTPGGEVIRSWMDGSVMQVVGTDQQSAGRAWRNVKDPTGNVGWIAAEFLAPAPASAGTPAATARPAATPTKVP